MELGIEALTALGGVALAAGFLDAIAGGGGLLTLPALLLAGLDPVTAIATNKLQGSFGTASSTFAYSRAGRIEPRAALPMAGVSLIASVMGAFCVRLVPGAVLAALVPVLMLAIAAYFALSPRIGEADARRRMAAAPYTVTLVPLIGLYDGFFGPGAGSFYMVGFVTLLGFGIVKAMAHTKALNLGSNVGSLAFYAASGLVIWPVGLVMGFAALTGAQLGSRAALRFGPRLIRPLIVVVCCAVAIKLLLDPANTLRRALVGLVSGQ